jgi:3-oxoacyl-[acyl-carrier protein] reductase
MGEFADQTVVITGSSRGLGRGMAVRFGAEGANVVTHSRSEAGARATAREIRDGDGTAIAVSGDIADVETSQRLVDRAVEEFGQLDIMFNNAGLFQRTLAMEMSPEEWQRFLDVMLSGVFYGCQAAGRQLIEQGTGGHIINISSIYSDIGSPIRAAYTSAKGGVNSLTKSLAVELAEHDIHVNAIAPGFIDTGGPAREDDASDQPDLSQWPRTEFSVAEIENRTPLGRAGTIEEITNCAMFLADGDHFMTGSILVADGGWHAFGWGSKGR